MEIQEVIRANSQPKYQEHSSTLKLDAADSIVVDGDILPVADMLDADGDLAVDFLPPSEEPSVPETPPIDLLKTAQDKWERLYDRLEARNMPADAIRSEIGEYPTSIEELHAHAVAALGHKALSGVEAAVRHSDSIRDAQLAHNIARIEANERLTTEQQRQEILQLKALDAAVRQNAGKRA